MNPGKGCCKLCAYSVAIVGVFLLVAGLAWVMHSSTQPEPLGEDRAALRRKNLAELKAANQEVLHTAGYVWQDQGRGVVRLPIDRAVEVALQLWQDPAAARSNLTARVEKATAKAPEKPSQFE